MELVVLCYYNVWFIKIKKKKTEEKKKQVGGIPGGTVAKNPPAKGSMCPWKMSGYKIIFTS